jgi:hypothetical protein
VHPVVELALAGAATVEIEYTGGLEVLTPAERVEPGDPSEALRVLDFRQVDRNFVATVEGVPGVTYTLALRSGVRVRSVTGAELVEQSAERVQLRVRLPPSSAPFVRRELIVRL